jgi:hypothetical protein
MGEARTSTRRTSFGFYSCRAICSSPKCGGGLEEREWRDGSCVSRRSHTMARPKNGQEEVGGRENGNLLLCCAEQPTSWLLLCCRAGPLLMPGWPIVWVASSVHAPPSSSSFTLLLFLPPPSPFLSYTPPSSQLFNVPAAIIML